MKPYADALKLPSVSPWCNSKGKRAWDLLCAVLLLLLLFPVLLLIGVVVKVTSRGPVLFRQPRPGKGGHEFSILKFRTMVADAHETGPVLTRAFDPRVTPVGRWMRKWKLDELPQLWNVVRGDMSFVGPRPQVTKLWTNPVIYKEAACVLSVRPGISSQTTLAFRNEEELLAPFSSWEVEEIYLREIMPLKVNMELEYLATASFTEDLQIIMRTIGRIFVPQSAKDGFLKQQLAVVGSSLSREAGNAEKSPAQAPPSREQPLEEASRSAVAGD